MNLNYDIYKMKEEIIFNSFFYICPVENCGSKISFPTSKMLDELKQYLNNDKKKFEEFRCLASSIQDWIPYFDGLNSLIYF